MDLQQLIDGTSIRIEFHESLNVWKCIVTCQYGMELNDEELQKELKPQRVVQVRRFMKKNPKDSKKNYSDSNADGNTPRYDYPGIPVFRFRAGEDSYILP